MTPVAETKNTQTFTIKTAYIDAVKQHLNKISKKAKKVQVAEPKLIIGDEKLVKKYPQDFLLDFGLEKSEPWFESYTEITVEWEDIHISGGWRFAATVEKCGNGNMVLGVPELSDRLPTDLRTAQLTCEHCQTKRNRKKHIVLINDANEVKIVGSSCIKDFLGHDVESKIAILEAEYEFMRLLSDEDNQWGQESGMLEPPLKMVISQTFAILRYFPWVKSADSDIMNGKIPTYSEVQRQFFDRKLKNEDRILVEPQDIEKAEQVLEIWRKVAENSNPATCSEWDWKKKLIVERESVEYKKFGLVVGLAYGEWSGIQRKLEQTMSKPAAAPSEFFGEVGKRDIFELVISRVKLVDGFRGSSEMITGFQEGTNNKFIWFNSGYQDCYEQGEKVKVKATVKAHDTHEIYGKQTMLTRLAAIS